MKVFVGLLWIFFCAIFAVQAGCEGPDVVIEAPRRRMDCNELSIYSSYGPDKVCILPLTELVGPDNPGQQATIKVYTSLLDVFGSAVKSPAVFRFELYEYVQHSAEPKGGRVFIWPDMDLTDPVKNNRYWRDFLRAYEFGLDLQLQGSHSYVLEVTCLCSNGRRLWADFVLKATR